MKQTFEELEEVIWCSTARCVAGSSSPSRSSLHRPITPMAPSSHALDQRHESVHEWHVAQPNEPY